jgi:hypothetical protein
LELNGENDMNIKESSLLGRWYLNWVGLGGRQRKPENLCRFLRVVCFYAPVRWFFIKGNRDCSPAGFMSFLLVLGFVLSMFGYSFYDDWKISLVLVLIVIATGLAIIELIRVIAWSQYFYQEKIATREWFYSGKSGKFCPLIEFVQDNTEKSGDTE